MIARIAHGDAGPRYRWYAVGMLWAISFCNYADRQAVFSVFPLLQKQMGLNAIQLGLLGSSFAWVYGLASQTAGMVVDRVRRKTAILGGLHAWSLICLCTGLARGFRSLLLLRAAEGLGETFYYPASMSLIGDYHGQATRSKAIGLHQTSVYAGTIAGGFFAGLIAQSYGWRWSFYVFGGMGLLLGVVLQRYLREPARGAADFADSGYSSGAARAARLGVGESLRAVWGSRTAVMLMAAFVCANFVAVVLLSWMPAFLYGKFHVSLAVAGLTATLFAQLASTAGSITGGCIADWWRARSPRGRMLLQAIGVLSGAPFVALCGRTESVGLLIFALTAWGFCKGLYDANIFASLFDVVRPEVRGTASGWMNTVGWLGGGAAPVLIGIASTHYGLGPSIAMTSCVYVLAGAFLLTGAYVFAVGDTQRVRLAIEGDVRRNA